MSKIRTSHPDAAPALTQPAAAVARVAFLVVPRFNMTTMMTMIEVMRIANYLSPSPLYHWEVLSFDGEEITASVSNKARQVTVKLLPGDGVTVEISPYDPTRGRIKERLT